MRKIREFEPDCDQKLLDWTPIFDGLYVSALGMGMVMAVLVVLAITVWGVSKADRAIDARREAKLAQEAEEASEGVESKPVIEQEDLANVAVIAVAIALTKSAEERAGASDVPMPDQMGAPTNDWTSQGRARQWSRRPTSVGEAWKR